jgi:hypothetical protein
VHDVDYTDFEAIQTRVEPCQVAWPRRTISLTWHL